MSPSPRIETRMNLTRTQVEDLMRGVEYCLKHGARPLTAIRHIIPLCRDWLELDRALRPSTVELPVEFIAGWECQREACFQFTPFAECEKDESGRSIPPPWCPECGDPPRKLICPICMRVEPDHKPGCWFRPPDVPHRQQVPLDIHLHQPGNRLPDPPIDGFDIQSSGK